FPLVRVDQKEPGALDVQDFLKALRLPAGPSPRGRAQVVYGQENEFWVLAKGGLLKLRLTPPLRGGLGVVPLWTQPLPVGSPLHAGRVEEAGARLSVPTQSPTGQACLPPAVDAETGSVRWQRQLGLVCQREPLALRRGVLAADQGGGLFFFDYRSWQSG